MDAVWSVVGHAAAAASKSGQEDCRNPGLFDRRGNVVIPARFDFAERFSEGMAAVCQGCRRIDRGEHWSMEGGEWCFINRAGALNIRLRFDAAQSFAKGRARVRIAGVRRYIGRNGRLAAP